MTPSTSRSRNEGSASSGKPDGSAPTVLNPYCASGVTDSATIAAITTTSATGRPGSQRSPEHSSAIAARPNGQHARLVSGSCVASTSDALEEVLAPALHAEELRELRHRDRERGARLEAEQDRLADEVDERREAQRPRRDDADDREHERRERGDLRRNARRRPSPCRPRSCPPASRLPTSVRSPAGATCRTARTRARRRDSNTRRTAAAVPRAPRRRARPGSRTPRA